MMRDHDGEEHSGVCGLGLAAVTGLASILVPSSSFSFFYISTPLRSNG
jgi:hypothetical protein